MSHSHFPVRQLYDHIKAYCKRYGVTRDRCLYELEYLEAHGAERESGGRLHPRRRIIMLVVLLIVGVALAVTQRSLAHEHPVAGLGTVNFPTSCNASAQSGFPAERLCCICSAMRKRAWRSMKPPKPTLPAVWLTGVWRGPGITRYGRRHLLMSSSKAQRPSSALWPLARRPSASAITSMP